MSLPSFARPACILATGLATLLLARAAAGATVTWDTAAAGSALAGGTGTWNLTTDSAPATNFTIDGGATKFAWDNTLNAADVASFGLAGGTVTLGTGDTINAAGLQFGMTGYSVTGGTALNFGAALGSIDTSTLGASGATSLAAALTGAGGLTIAANGDLSATGGGSGGALTLSGANTGLTGGIAITSGLVNFTTAAAAGSAATTAGSGDTLALSNGAGLVSTGGVTLGNNFTIGTGGGTIRAYSGKTVTLNGAITGTGTLNKTDSGTLVLANPSTVTAPLEVKSGSLQIGTNPTVTTTYNANSTAVTVDSGATLVLGSASGGSITVTYNFTGLGGTPIAVNSGTVSFVQTNNTTQALSAGLALSGNTTLAFAANAFSGHTVNLNGALSGSGILTFTTSGNASARNFTIGNAANSFGGTVVLGTSATSSTFNLNKSLGATAYTVNSWNLVNGGAGALDSASLVTLNTTGATLTLTNPWSNAGATLNFVAAGTVSIAAGATNLGTLSGAGGTINGTTATSSLTVAGGTFGGALTGTLAVAQSGLGSTLTLAGSNTYSGTTSVQAGTLVVGGALSGTSGLAVSSGGTFQLGAGEVLNDSAPVSLTAGTFQAAGFSETAGTLTLGAGLSTIDFGAGNSGNLLLLANSSALAWSGTLRIADWAGNSGGGGLDELGFGGAGGLTPAQIAAISFENPAGFAPGTYGSQLLSTGELVPIPEPNVTWALLGGLGAWVTSRRRRR